MLITKEIEIDMGHRVPNHKSKCKNIHGHRYKIEVGVSDKVILTSGSSDEGMVIDFGDLKAIMMEEIDAKLDHGFMIYDKDPLMREWMGCPTMLNMKFIVVDFVPTAENIAKYLYYIMKEKLEERGIRIYSVKIWETPTSTATYNSWQEKKEPREEKKCDNCNKKLGYAEYWLKHHSKLRHFCSNECLLDYANYKNGIVTSQLKEEDIYL